MVLKKIWKGYLRWFDRSFSKGWFDQVKFLTVVILCMMVVWYFIALLFKGEGNFLRIIELMLDPGAFDGSDKSFPIFLSLLVAISGAVLFSAMLITVIGNIVSNRMDEYKKGLLRYDFDHHILILGANSTLVNMLKEIAADKELCKKQIVVLTTSDTEKLKDSVAVKISDIIQNLDITYLYGIREQEETLKYVQADEAHSIYILGEDNEEDHDSKNIKCWKNIQKVCENTSYQIQCYMLVERLSSFHVFQFSSEQENERVRLTVINSLENWAQRVLVARIYKDNAKYPSIVGDTAKDFNKNVRFVVFGMTQMAYAMATTVAHIVHKPHFKGGPDAQRTKICFVMPNIEQEMNFFIGHYDSLFKLSHSRLYKYTQGDNNKFDWEYKIITRPDEKIYGDFLDIEWEFIDGSIEDGHVRDLLVKYANNKDEKLSLAICNYETKSNISAALYLPGEIYCKNVPVFVYQPNEGDILSFANETFKYSNVYPFGMKTDCYDPLFKKRLSKAKKINYLYSLENQKKPYLAMPNDEELDRLWNEITSYVIMYSNIYSAASIPLKLKLILRDVDILGSCPAFTANEVETLAIMEHNRWNIEKLLMGFSPLTRDERNIMKFLKNYGNISEMDKAQLKTLLRRDISNDEFVFRIINKELKNKLLMHMDITPYEDLLSDSKDYDRAIACNILDVEN